LLVVRYLATVFNCAFVFKVQSNSIKVYDDEDTVANRELELNDCVKQLTAKTKTKA